jgi:TonB family protein
MILRVIVPLLWTPLMVLLCVSQAAAAENCPAPGFVRFRPIMDTHTEPPYPSIAQMTDEEGTTTVEVTIGKDGSVSKAGVFKSSGSLRLDDMAVEHVKANWRWEPAKRDCEPVEAVTRVNIVWRLRDQPEALPPGVAQWTPDMADYPPEARARREQGGTVIGVALSENGEVLAARVAISSGFPALDDKALVLVKSRKWQPAQMDGKAIPTVIQLAVLWTLEIAGKR